MPAFARDNSFRLNISRCPHPVEVLAFSGDEALNTPFAFDVELVCDRADLELEVLLHTRLFWPLMTLDAVFTGRFIRSSGAAQASASRTIA